MKIVLFVIIAFFAGLIALSFVTKCYEPGEGVMISNLEVIVPVHIKGMDENDPSTLWVDSKEKIVNGKISKGQDFIISTILGSIDLCYEDTETKVVVPASLCKDLTVPQYPSSGFEGDYSPSIICANHGEELSSEGFYVDTDIIVNPNDQITFEIIPKTLEIKDCDDSHISIYPDGPLRNSDGTQILDYQNKPIEIDRRHLCFNGKTIKFNESEESIQLGPYYNTSHEIIVDSSLSPYGNKVYLHPKDQLNQSFLNNNPASRIPWLQAKSLDLRSALNPSSEIIKYIHENPGACAEPLDDFLKQFSSYSVNEECGNICTKNTNLENSQHCVHTLRYKYQYIIQANNEIQITDTPTTETLRDKTSFKSINPQYSNKYEISTLVAKISENKSQYNDDNVYNDDTKFDSIGLQCWPGNNKGMCITQSLNNDNYSIVANTPYIVDKNIPPKSKLMLAIAGVNGNYHNHVGGYYVKIKKQCKHTNASKLYMYVGDNPSSIAPGDPGSYHLELKSFTNQNNITSFEPILDSAVGEFDKDNLHGKLFFGIQGAASSETVKSIEKGKVYSDIENGYKVTIPKQIWKPYISEIFVKTRNLLISIIYGEQFIINNDGKYNFNTDEITDLTNLESYYVKKGAVQMILSALFDNGFGNLISVMLVLYIIFSTLGFLIGTTKVSSYEIFFRIVKFSVISAMLTKKGWLFLSSLIFETFIVFPHNMSLLFSNNLDASNDFSFLDSTLGVFLASETWLRIASMVPSGILGTIFAILMIWSITQFILATAGAILFYLSGVLITAFLMSLSPIFILTLLFEKTKTLFQSWLKLMISFGLGPVLLFAGIAMLYQVSMYSFYKVLGYGACVQCWWFVPVESFPNGGFCMINILMPSSYSHSSDIDSQVLYTYQSIGTDSQSFMGMPFTLSDIIVLLVSSSVMANMVKMSESILLAITSSMSSGSYMSSSQISAIKDALGLDSQNIKKAQSFNPQDKIKVDIKDSNRDYGAQSNKKEETKDDEKAQDINNSNEEDNVTRVAEDQPDNHQDDIDTQTQTSSSENQQSNENNSQNNSENNTENDNRQ